MVLVKCEGGNHHTGKPKVKRNLKKPILRFFIQKHPKKHAFADMERRTLIVREIHVEQGKPGLKNPETFCGANKNGFEGKGLVADDGQPDQKTDSFGEKAYLASILQHEKAEYEDQIRGHIGNDHPGDKGDVLFPGKEKERDIFQL